ncbi:MAG TPA: glycoside hydrolase family 20 zincin-like fold domain-containing protein, partial [Chitinophagaceae bacterium]|nr:glycoside hydrolase family 20 zincin-like fold domain-containing protein [Chitinophagaceae bacterium]
MEKIYGLLILSMLYLGAFAQEPTTGIAIIPEPVSTTVGKGHFNLPEHVSIWATRDSNMAEVITFLKEKLTVATGRQVTFGSGTRSTIRLLINHKIDTILGDEGYRLSVKPTHIEIRANQPAGLFYGAQTLVQLFPKEIESPEPVYHIRWTAPCVEILDYPRF